MRKATLYHLTGIAVTVTIFLSCVYATSRYYGTYVTYGSGDTIINPAGAHLGPHTGKRKWNVECLDGEALIGVGDFLDDFQKVSQLWCKFMFPYKQPTNGLYPYYPDCFVKNYTFQFHCYTPKYHEASVNSFMVGLWDNDMQFFAFRPILDDPNPYKCCKTPPGYYVDYLSCYYLPTRDQYGEYYDASNWMLIYCATGYAMTGMAKKISPWTNDYHIEWIQCCRLGFGAIPTRKPESNAYSYDSYANSSYPNKPAGAYADQYNVANLGSQNIQHSSSYDKGQDSYGGGSVGQGSYGAGGAGGYSGGRASRSMDSDQDHQSVNGPYPQQPQLYESNTHEHDSDHYLFA